MLIYRIVKSIIINFYILKIINKEQQKIKMRSKDKEVIRSVDITADLEDNKDSARRKEVQQIFLSYKSKNLKKKRKKTKKTMFPQLDEYLPEKQSKLLNDLTKQMDIRKFMLKHDSIRSIPYEGLKHFVKLQNLKITKISHHHQNQSLSIANNIKKFDLNENSNLQTFIEKKKQLMLKRNFHTEESRTDIKVTDVDQSFCDQNLINKKYQLNKKHKDLGDVYQMLEQQKSKFKIIDEQINIQIDSHRSKSNNSGSVQNHYKQDRQKKDYLIKSVQDTSPPQQLFNMMNDLSTTKIQNDKNLIDNLVNYSKTRCKSIQEKSDIYDIFTNPSTNLSSKIILRKIFEQKLNNRLHENYLQIKIFNKMISKIQMQHKNLDKNQLNFLNEVQEQVETGNIINKQMHQKLRESLQQLGKTGFKGRRLVREELITTRTTLLEQENQQIWKIIDAYINEMSKHQIDLNQVKEQLVKN